MNLLGQRIFLFFGALVSLLAASRVGLADDEVTVADSETAKSPAVAEAELPPRGDGAQLLDALSVQTAAPRRLNRSPAIVGEAKVDEVKFDETSALEARTEGEPSEAEAPLRILPVSDEPATQ